MRSILVGVSAVLLGLAAGYTAAAYAQNAAPATTGQGARGVFGSWRDDAPGKRWHITPDVLPRPFATGSSSNGVRVIAKPARAELKVPPGFEVKLFAGGLLGPRQMRVAPNGDIFIAETNAGRIRVLRPAENGASPARNEVFAGGLRAPFGIAFYPADDPQWVYVGNTDSVVRFPYRSGDLKAEGRPEVIVPRLPTGGHSTRDVAFSRDGTRMFVSVGSGSNVGEGMGRLDGAALRKVIEEKPLGAAWGNETDRAAVLVFDPQGQGRRLYATGIRNCVGMAVQPMTGDLWCSTNERDGLGDNVAPDYITRVREGAFYGWPWYYTGGNEDPRRKGERPDLKDKVTVPDILVQAHSASLGMTFYSGGQFPAEYKGAIFAAEHGSWNRSTRTGHKIIRGILKDGVPTGEYEDFVVGFVIDDGLAWGRPVGVAEAKDGSLLFSEDGNGTIWRVTHTAAPPAP
jgi:glucose/arabinose dehydrogenase